jgi:hypothetical protein
MADAPKPGSLTNVFGLDKPQHIYTKMMVEIMRFQDALSEWSKNEPYPDALFIAFNLAVTIWHMTDWLWVSGPTNRQMLAKKFNFTYDELKKGGLDNGLKLFQDKVRAEVGFKKSKAGALSAFLANAGSPSGIRKFPRRFG